MSANLQTMISTRNVPLPCPRCRSKSTELVRDSETNEIVFTDGKCIITCKTCDRTEIVVLRRSWLGKLSAWPATQTERRPSRWFGIRQLAWLVMVGIAIGAGAISPKRWQMSVGSLTISAFFFLMGAAAIWKQTTDHWATMTIASEYRGGETHFHGIEAIKGGIGWIIMAIFFAIMGTSPFWLGYITN